MPFLDLLRSSRFACISTLRVLASLRISDSQYRALMPASSEPLYSNRSCHLKYS
jgi:hypothetical protein